MTDNSHYFSVDIHNARRTDKQHMYSLNVEFFDLMKQNNMILFAFPPYISQWLQSFDKTVFSTTKAIWNSLGCEFVRQLLVKCPINVEILEMLAKAYKKDFT